MKQGQVLHSPAATVAEALVILVFIAALLGSPILKPVLKCRPLVFLGKISYSLFLLHSTVIFMVALYVLPMIDPWLVKQSEPIVWAAFAAYATSILVVATALSYLSYRYIESPFLRYKPK